MDGVSDNIKSLYTDLYSDSKAREWRDLSALDKSDNVIALWRQARGAVERPSVVEIGCGEGALADSLSSRDFFASYRGFDISSSGIAEAASRGVANAEFGLIDGSDVPATTRSADLAILSHVVEHLEHPRVMLYEAARLAPYVFVEVPLELTARAPRDYEVDALGHINKYNPVAIRHLVQSCGFEVLAARTMNPRLEMAQFLDPSTKRRVSWEIKSRALRLAPGLAPHFFVYHGALLLRSPEK